VLGTIPAKIKSGRPLDDSFEVSDLEIARLAIADRAVEISVLALKK
jgi:hypothetical protein